MIRKWTVNTTLAKGHHTPTQRTARNFSTFSHASSMSIHYIVLFFDWGDDYSQDPFPVIQVVQDFLNSVPYYK
jgi:hypothetical protein